MQEKINALVDGRLPPADEASVRGRIADDQATQKTLQAWQSQREALRALHRPLLDEAIPEALLAAAQRGQQGRRQLERWWRWGGMAAGVMLAFGAGWLSHGQLDDQASRQMTSSAMRPAHSFVQQASLAHAVFSPEVRHPVEVTAAQQEHLVQWLSKRLGKPLRVPLLTAQGYELVGGRLLPGDRGNPGHALKDGVRAQFMFQNAEGVRMTLYLGALEAASSAGAAAPATRETDFRYSGDGPVPSFYWVDQGFGYALSGPLSRDALMALAQVVYRQL